MSVESVENFDLLIIYKFDEYKKDEENENEEDNKTDKAKKRIFEENFVIKNKNNFKIIYKNKEYELTEYFEDIDKNYNYNNLILLKLKVTNNKTDMSYMFFNCSGLLSVSNNTDEISSKDASESEENFYFNNQMSMSIESKLNSLSDNNFSDNDSFNQISSIQKKYTDNTTNIDDILCENGLLSSLSDINIIDISYMFYGCSSLISLPNISDWNNL